MSDYREFMGRHPKGSTVVARIGGRGCKFHGEPAATVTIKRYVLEPWGAVRVEVEFKPKRFSNDRPIVNQKWTVPMLNERMKSAKAVTQ